MDRSRITEYLEHVASGLSGSAYPPIAILQLCCELGLDVKRSASVRSGARLRGAGRARTILLPEANDGRKGLNSAERFNIAHEIAHFILETAHVPLPLGKSEYWQHEVLCHDFAARLLCPDAAVAIALRHTPHQARELLQASLGMRDDWCTPWAPVAYRIAECVRQAAFFRLAAQGDFLVVKVSTLQGERHKNRRFHKDDKVYQDLLGLKVGRRRVPDALPAESVDGFAPHSPVRTAAAVRLEDRDIVMAVVGGAHQGSEPLFPLPQGGSLEFRSSHALERARRSSQEDLSV